MSGGTPSIAGTTRPTGAGGLTPSAISSALTPVAGRNLSRGLLGAGEEREDQHRVTLDALSLPAAPFPTFKTGLCLVRTRRRVYAMRQSIAAQHRATYEQRIWEY